MPKYNGTIKILVNSIINDVMKSLITFIKFFIQLQIREYIFTVRKNFALNLCVTVFFEFPASRPQSLNISVPNGQNSNRIGILQEFQ